MMNVEESKKECCDKEIDTEMASQTQMNLCYSLQKMTEKELHDNPVQFNPFWVC